MNSLKTKQVTTKQVRTNATSGSYRPFFFDAEEFNVKVQKYSPIKTK